mgnify:FL=1
MGLISWLVDRFGGPVSVSYNGDLFEEYEDLVGDIYIRELAFLSAVNLVANAVSKCEFKTFTKGKEEKGREYYLWNLEPNKNQNSSVFIHKLISKLYRNNECLVIDQSGQLLVADNFNRKPYALYEDVFTQVQVGDFTFDRSFAQSEVLYFNLTESDTKKVVDGLYNSYSKLITYSMKAYQKSRGTKGIFQYDTLPVAGTPERDAFDKLINEKIKKWLDGDSAALPLGRGQEWKELEKKTYSSESTRDIKALVDDISDFTARAFGIPPALLRGDVQDTSKAVDQLLTFCIDSLVDMIQEEINRKRNGYAGFSQGTYLKIDTKTMKHVDLLSVSTAIDKLISSGAFCVNDIRELVGEPVIEEDWANEHFITRNYMPFEEALKALKGGETD